MFDQIGAPRALAAVIDQARSRRIATTRWQTIDDLANAVRIACGDPPLTKTTEVIRAQNMQAPANLTTQRPAVTPPPMGVAQGTAPPPSSYTPPPSTSPPAGGVATAGASPTAPGVKTQWTGQLVVPDAAPDRPAAGKSKAPLAIGVAIVVAGGAIAAALVLKGGGGGGGGQGSGSAVALVGSGSGGSAGGAAPIDAGPAPEALPAHVEVSLETDPPGADIYDFDTKALVGEDARQGRGQAVARREGLRPQAQGLQRAAHRVRPPTSRTSRCRR